jgi:hypothetical protein
MTDEPAREQQHLQWLQRAPAPVREYVEARHHKLQERLHAVQGKAAGWGHGLIFPNMSSQTMNIFGPVGTTTVLICHPKGVDESEIWAYYFIDRDAPPLVKAQVARAATGGQGPAGLIGLDDSENFERMVEACHAPMGQQLSFNFGMTLPHEGHWRDQDTWDVQGLPGLVGPEFSEHNQRQFFRYWAGLMGLPAD